MDHGTTWDLLLPHAEFAYNNSINRNTGRSPFKIVTGLKPRTPLDLVPLPLPPRVSEGASDFYHHLQEVHDEVRRRITQSNAAYKEQADSHRRYLEFQLGDLALINIHPERFPKAPIFNVDDLTAYHGHDYAPQEDTPIATLPIRSKLHECIKAILDDQGECELVKIDINCYIQGDVVVECVSLNDEMAREEMMFRVMFNTSRSNILILNWDEIDILWNAKDQFPKDFRAEILFSEMDVAASAVVGDISSFEEEGLPVEAFAKVQEFFSYVD
ncbi:formin-like protein 6 [Carya illinoinensis]|uniref:formin-like protein 6 n=1 Tax=Carya illinoinensis TaxID=32201 RepID=UPI001C727727|nr:formin-like protein 6 [Carya illinoinensis]